MKAELVGVLALAHGGLCFCPANLATSHSSSALSTGFAHTNTAAAATCTPSVSSRPSVASRPSLIPVWMGKSSLQEELDSIEGDGTLKAERKSKKDKKGGADKPEKVKLEPEVTFFEGSPDISETFVPAVSILTVIGIVPFAASVARQIWVKYNITSRRISVQSGIGGKDVTEVVYPEIKKMAYVFRMFGRCGDIVMTLKDGSNLEIRSLPNFEENYEYILSKCSKECQEISAKLPGKRAEAEAEA